MNKQKSFLSILFLSIITLLSPPANARTYTTVDGAKSIIENIIAVVGLKPKFEIKEANIPNAAAVLYNSKRYVLYNPNFVDALNKAAGNQWASVSILAHEIGHHLNGHTLQNGGSSPELELEADEFSGFVLRKMGATLPEAQAAMKLAANQRASHTHPAQADRLYAIAKGWSNAQNQVAGNADMAKTYDKPAPVTTQPNRQVTVTNTRTNQTAIDDRYIAQDVHFTNDRYSYYITVKNHLIKTDGSNLYLVGVIAPSDNAEFPLVIYDTKKNYLFVNRAGSIVTSSGKKVGYITQHDRS